MCLGGHLAFRCAFDPRVAAAVTYFATDVHSGTLGEGKKDDSLARSREIKGELAAIFGTADTHVPPEGRDLIRKTLRDNGIRFSFYEIADAQRKSIIAYPPVYNASLPFRGRHYFFPDETNCLPINPRCLYPG